MYKVSWLNDEYQSMANSLNRSMAFKSMFVNCIKQTESRFWYKNASFVFIHLANWGRFILNHWKFTFPPFTYYQIYAPRLDDPTSGTFESCSSDTFQIDGPCAYQICYVYLYRSGSDGWKPESVKINGYNGRPVTFYYNTFIPRDTWYGFNLCNDAASSSQVTAKKWLICVVLGFVLSFWL